MDTSHIGKRVRALRERAKMTQDALAAVLNLKDRQSVSQIETGQRRVSGEELIRLTRHFNISLENLTDPFQLFGRDSFSWRQKNVSRDDLDSYEQRAGQWVGAYRVLSGRAGTPRRALLPNLNLTHKSRFEDAVRVGERVADFLDLGDAPAFELAEAIERKFDILVLNVDALPGISGAACHLPDLDCILINRHDTPGRRRSDLAHELFHILTWATMKPERIESSDDTFEVSRSRKAERNVRIEQLADNFTFGLLMPDRALDQLPPHRADADWLDAAADRLGVSSRNLKWRLVNSGRAPEMVQVTNEALNERARIRGAQPPPPPFSKLFLEALLQAHRRGEVTLRRIATLLDTTLEDIGELCDAHDVERPEELID